MSIGRQSEYSGVPYVHMDTSALKHKLITEKGLLEEELGYIGEKNQQGSYTAKPADTDEVGFRDEVADRLEELDERIATEGELEIRYRSVLRALDKLENNTYGLCEVCSMAIEHERLEANPAARTCKAHLDGEKALP